MLIAEDYLGDEPFVMYLGDNLLKDGIVPFVERFAQSAPDAMILLQHVPDPQSYGVAEIADGVVVRLVEKPAEPRSDLALVGRLPVHARRSSRASRRSRPRPAASSRSPTPSSTWSTAACACEPHVVTGWWKDTGRARGHARSQPPHPEHPRARRARRDRRLPIEGPVAIEAGSRLTRCTVRGPVIIGHGCALTDAFVGPYTAIYHGVTVDHAEIEHSIILANSRISGLKARLCDSLIGNDVTICHAEGRPAAYRFMVGDSSRIGVI